MKIVVCLKQTLDPEIAPKDFKIDAANRKLVQGNAKQVLDSYAENALELALQLRDKHGGTVTALTVDDKPADKILGRALALTADKAVRVWDAAWADLDAHALAHVIARAIEKEGGADLVLFGRQSADAERGLVGSMVAEELGFACITVAATVEVADAKARVQREVSGGFTVVEVDLPAAVTVTSHATNTPRLPKVKDTMMAMRKPIPVLAAGDLDVDADRTAPRVQLRDLLIPTSEGDCELIAGDEPRDQAGSLVTRLRERKVL